MTNTEMISLAKDAGFSDAAVLPTDEISFDFSFRVYCEENLCGKYGANYSCPPDCGTPEEMEQRILSRKNALVLQTIWEISDYTDEAAIRHAKKTHNNASISLMNKLRERGHDCFMAGASGCDLCAPCSAAAGLPCRIPDQRFSCLSAYCIFVRALAERCGMEYTCGDGLLAFFGMIVFD